jgi:hypothetical protein
MYFSPAYWKNDPKVVARELRKLTSETVRYSALKEKNNNLSEGVELGMVSACLVKEWKKVLCAGVGRAFKVDN